MIYLIIVIITFLFTALGAFFIFINRKDNVKLKEIKKEILYSKAKEAVISKKIDELKAKAIEVKDEKSTTNIDDLLSEFSVIERLK